MRTFWNLHSASLELKYVPAFVAAEVALQDFNTMTQPHDARAPYQSKLLQS